MELKWNPMVAYGTKWKHIHPAFSSSSSFLALTAADESVFVENIS